MWKQKIGISVGNNYSIPTTDVIKMLKAIGFDAISPEFTSKQDLEKIAKIAKEYEIELQSLHAPFSRSADMWSDNPEINRFAKSEISEALDACVQFAIPVLVVHTWIGFDYTFDNNLYFGNFDEIVAYAKSKGIKIAFENTEGEEYLFALMHRYRNDDTVGFCWDSGHEMCYNHSQDLLAEYGDRLIMTHINDNLGISRFGGKTFWTDDLHLLPYDGIADWEYNIKRLKNSRKQEILNFELNIHSKPNRFENDTYENMPLQQYFTEAYKRACRIAYRYSK